MSFSIVGALIMMVVCTVVTALLTKAPPNAAASALGDFTVPTAEEGRPFSILLGTGKCKGPNVTWYGDLHVGDVSVHGGLFKGPQVIGHFYSLGMQQMLCIGPIDSLEDILIGDKSLKARGVSFPQAYSALGTRITITHDQGYDLFGGSQSEGGVTGTLSFYFGSDTQDSDPYLERVLGAPLPAYRNVCYAVLERMYLGTSPYLKNWAWVLRHCPCPAGFDPSKKDIDGDCNAAYGLAYLLTLSRELGGLGESLASLDLASFQGAANTLYAEKFGISLLIDTAKSADAWMAEILHHINAVLYTDPATGLTSLKLIRDDYDPDTLPEFTEADWMEAPEITVSALPETLNRVIVRYVDRGQDFTTRTAQGQDVANYWSQGQNASITLDFLALSNATNAQKVASREMFMLAAQMVKGSGKLNRRAWNLRPGSPFKLTFPPQGIQGLVCRVTNIRYGTLGSGGITIEFAQDVFSISAVAHEAPPASTWQNPLAAPVACSAQDLVEAPYGLVGESRQVLALGARGDATTTAAEIWTNEGSGYLLTGTLSPMSPTGLLGASWSAKTAALDMGGFTVGAGVDLDRLPGASTNADGRARGVNLALFESGEIVSWTTATRNADGTYAISGGILRGVLDTVPVDHAAGERVWFITEGSADTRSLSSGGSGGTGEPGDDGEDGRSYVWHGEWDPSHAYSVDDTCRRNGSSYVCIQDCTGQDPATATAYWDLMAQKGADGAGGGSAGSYSFWDPDKAPVSPSSLDDEFSTSSTALESKWAWKVNWASWSTLDVNTTVPLQLYLKRGGTSPFMAVLQSLPAGDFTIVGKFRVNPAANYYGVGIVVSSTPASGAGVQNLVGLRYDSQLYRGVEAWTNFTTQGTVNNYATHTPRTPIWVRVRRTGTTYYAAWSVDGIWWDEATFAPGATPLYFGIGAFVTITTAEFVIDYVRYYNSSSAQNGGVRVVGVIP